MNNFFDNRACGSSSTIDTRFGQLVHEKKIFKCFCYINLYKIVSPLSVAIHDPRDFIWAKLPCPKDVPCPRFFKKWSTFSLFCQPLYLNKSDPQAYFPASLVEICQVVHKKIFKSFCYISLYKIMSPYGMAICDPREFIWTKLNFLAPRISRAK